MSDTTVGFVGLGRMGQGMAANLLRAGYQVQVWNRSPGPVDELVGQGARRAADLAEAFGNEVVISMLADDPAVERLLADDLLDRAAARVHVNCATVSVALAKRAVEAHARHGVGYVAAPVFGRPEVAASGQLNVVAAGPAELVESVRPLLEAVGRKVWPMGEEPYRANVVKIAGNYLIASALEAMAEACALTEASGADPADLIELINNTMFPGPVYGGYGPMIAERRYDPAGFRLVLGLKDVNLALAAGADAHVPLPVGSVLRDAFLEAVGDGHAERDWAALGHIARRRAGLTA
jgi:3-hydroxyisobutyrate dehydrogenase-like beta-hydroxyacid dehydrogenase